MQVAYHYIENSITHFIRRINRCISYGCANGQVEPFVDHDAFVQWSAMQDASFIEPDCHDGTNKHPDGGKWLQKDKGNRMIWSKANVSETFNTAVCLSLKDYTRHWAAYYDGGSYQENCSWLVMSD
jgi:hypothetical protein